MNHQAAQAIARQIRHLDVKEIEVLKNGAGWAVYVTGWTFTMYVNSTADMAAVAEAAARDA